MPKLLVFEGTYYSPSDESAFFGWLRSIPGVTRVVGNPRGLEVSLRSKLLSESSLRELLALHFRYRLPMRDLAQFKTEKNTSWFSDPSAYWYLLVFGPSAVSANLEQRLQAMREAGATPTQAIKAVHHEYRVSLGQAKRLFSISPAWQGHAQANRPLQEEAIGLAQRSSSERPSGGT